MCDTFTNLLRVEYGFDAVAPYTGASFDLITDEFVNDGNREKKTRRAVANANRNQGVFARLLAAGSRLISVIGRNEGGANKDLAVSLQTR